MNEEWKTISDFPDYAVSSLGRVKRVVPDSMLTGDKHPTRYMPSCVPRGSRHGNAKFDENDVVKNMERRQDIYRNSARVWRQRFYYLQDQKQSVLEARPMNDMKSVIVPDSTQINADELQAGPITVTIAGVKIKGGKEQPVEISLEGMEKVYRPCKSMCRILVAAWGADASKYVGRIMTLYCDPSVKWGGLAVGGLRISHMSHISESITMALTVTRANKKPFTVRPIASGVPKAEVQSPVSTGFDDQKSSSVRSDASAPFSDDQIIEKLNKAMNGQALTEASELARSITDPANKERASQAYKSTLKRLRDEQSQAA